MTSESVYPHGLTPANIRALIKKGLLNPDLVPPYLNTRVRDITISESVSNQGDYKTSRILSNSSQNFSFSTLPDTGTIIGCTIVGWSEGAVVTENIDLFSDYGTIGTQQKDNFSESDLVNVVSFTAGQLFEMDLISVFPDLAANMTAGVQISHNLIGSAVNYLFIRLTEEFF